MDVSDRFMTERFKTIFIQRRSEMVNAHVQGWETVRNVGHLATFESERSNARERIEENVHVQASKTK
jgi:hypothetical protein